MSSEEFEKDYWIDFESKHDQSGFSEQDLDLVMDIGDGVWHSVTSKIVVTTTHKGTKLSQLKETLENHLKRHEGEHANSVFLADKDLLEKEIEQLKKMIKAIEFVIALEKKGKLTQRHVPPTLWQYLT